MNSQLFRVIFIFRKEYKKEVLIPVLQNILKEQGLNDPYDGMLSDDETPVAPPRGVSEIETKTRQVLFQHL